MLLQALCTRDFDELAAAFPRWDHRFRQIGGGSFQGELKFLEFGGIQIVRVSCNRRLHTQGQNATVDDMGATCHRRRRENGRNPPAAIWRYTTALYRESEPPIPSVRGHPWRNHPH